MVDLRSFWHPRDDTNTQCTMINFEHLERVEVGSLADQSGEPTRPCPWLQRPCPDSPVRWQGCASPRLPSQSFRTTTHFPSTTPCQGLRTYVEQRRAGSEQEPKTANPCGIAPPITMFPRRMTPGPQEAAGLVHPSPLIGSCRTRHQPWWFTMPVRLQKGQRTSTIGTG